MRQGVAPSLGKISNTANFPGICNTRNEPIHTLQLEKQCSVFYLSIKAGVDCGFV